jgi:pimeloyl-ACP methyl ester carboxylesterase
MELKRSASEAPAKSTNDRSFGALRGLFKVLSSVSLTATARLVERLFFTPPKARPSARALESLASGRRGAVILDGLPVAYWVWDAPGPIVYLLHGWGGTAAQLTSFVPELKARGHAVVAIDAPAHGASPGRRSSLLHFSRALRAVASVEGAPYAVIAHSLGGAAATHAMREGLPVSRAVFIGTPADVGRYFRDFLSSVGVPESRHDAVVRVLEKRFGFSWERLALPVVGPEMRTPLLVVHDEADAEISSADAALIARAWPGARRLATAGLGHRRILRDGGVIGRAVDFVSEPERERSTA